MAADGKVQIDVELNDKDARKGLNDIGKEAERSGGRGNKGIGKLSGGLRILATGAVASTAAIGGLAVGIGALAAPLVRAAGDAQALQAQFDQVFTGITDSATESLNTIAKDTGIASSRLQGAFTQIAAFAKTTGASTEDALKLTSRATLAAADSAAFYDKSIEEVTESLQSFLKGKIVAPL